jgi:hypothetical protein
VVIYPTRKRLMLLHLSGKVIRTTADRPFFVASQGWREAGDLRPGDPLLSHDGRHVPVEGISDSGEEQDVYILNPGGQQMPDRTQPSDATPRPILGFAAGTPILTAEGDKPIEELRPGDFIQSRPDGEPPNDDHSDDEDEGAEPPRWWEGN